MKQTYVALLIDSSASMSSFAEQALRSFNDMLNTIKERAVADNLPTKIMLVSFDGNYSILQKLTESNFTREVGLREYRANGASTAMFDAVGAAMEVLEDEAPAKANILLIVITDGQDNSSTRFNARQLSTRIKSLQGTDRWTIAMNVPHGYKSALEKMGIPSDNIKEWEQTTRGAQELGIHTRSALNTYYAASASGQTSVRNFYQPVTTDLSDVTKHDIKKLADLSSRFHEYEVSKESVIQSFVEAKTKRAYSLGTAYYQLMKTEKVQPSKAVLLRDKATGKVLGGHEARDLIGLPATDHARVKPGNHSNFDIFVQSNSTNRILPRGTHVLVSK